MNFPTNTGKRPRKFLTGGDNSKQRAQRVTENDFMDDDDWTTKLINSRKKLI